MNSGETRFAPCRVCGHETKHEILATRETTELAFDPAGSEGAFPIGSNKYALLECCGCETVTLRDESVFDPTGETTIRYYPPPLSRRFPKWLHTVHDDLRALLREIYAALAADSRSLVVMGARALLDMVMADKVGDVGSFVKKLEQLESQGFISRRNRDYLAVALDAGSAAAHRGHVPSVEAVNMVMDIVENLIEAVYVLPQAASELQKQTPPRKTSSPK